MAIIVWVFFFFLSFLVKNKKQKTPKTETFFQCPLSSLKNKRQNFRISETVDFSPL